MKLFEKIFLLLLDKKKELLMGDTKIFAIKAEDKDDKNHYYLEFDHTPSGWAMEQHHPNRGQIEELIARIILKDDPRKKDLQKFLGSKYKGKNLKTILKKDHKDIVQRLIDVKQITNAAKDIIIDVLKKSHESDNPAIRQNYKLGRGDKETYEQFWYNPKTKKFQYERGDTLAPGYPDYKKTFKTEKEFRKFLTSDHWFKMKDGYLTGKGQPAMFMPFYLADRGVDTLREYIERKSNLT